MDIISRFVWKVNYFQQIILEKYDYFVNFARFLYLHHICVSHALKIVIESFFVVTILSIDNCRQQ